MLYVESGVCDRPLSTEHYLDTFHMFQDICISAQKEKDIEAKLKVVVNDWSAQILQFASFKNRGELLLKGNQQTLCSDVLEFLSVSSELLSVKVYLFQVIQHQRQ